ncbi:hypothetical protein GPECTOR_39g394 [Gonium pectorale]|uniref:Pescadillo homolog n=1 Tax=Gonium pectorale TaxID=33097 RepID=A0A150GC14_GONPE|nr:hypothetical protein GPECTOR_39g394 [Gonium pectorale]|eukprot:KXZ46900.1 hypothetical protein GPECTOR_39g394 [Gonium pectorale]
MGKKLKKGKTGNAAQYITRTQAVRKLQLRLSEFRRLCILKGVHPREPKKKPKGANKTYYHTKDINWLAHEPLLNTFRNIKAHDRKIRKARAKQNADLAKRLSQLKPTYRLDHLVKERYPSFVDALRDMDDALTMVHLFATLPAESKYDIPTTAVHTARRLALEWQAYIVRSGALRRVFVSVKGYYFQAELLGQSVTWLVPHALSQVLPADVDYRVMLTFLEFYNTLLQFVNFKLYHMLGLRYPPVLDKRLEEAAAELAGIMKDIAGVRDVAEGDRAQGAGSGEGAAGADGGDADASDPQMRARIESLQTRLREIVGVEEAEGDADAADVEEEDEPDSEADGEEDDEPPVLDSGGEDDDEDDEEEEEEGGAKLDAAARSGGKASTSTAALLGDDDDDEDDDDMPADRRADAADVDAGTRAAGGALGPDVDPSDEAALCRHLFRGLVFFLGREVPREPLMLVVRAFGGVAAWDGEGSPYEETSEAITHQVVDRPRQGHRFLSREYVQPQWVFDSANFRVLMAADLYAPGGVPPPHLSPFVGETDENGYTPDFAKTVRRLQDAAHAARLRAAGLALKGADGSEFVGEGVAAGGEGADGADAQAAAGVDLEAAERVYAAELAKEVKQSRKRSAAEAAGSDGGDEEQEDEDNEDADGDEAGGDEDDDEQDDAPPRKKRAAGKAEPKATKKGAAATASKDKDQDEEAAMADIMMTRKTRKMYNNMKAKEATKREQAEQLEAKKAKLAAAGAVGPMGQAKAQAAAAAAVQPAAAPSAGKRGAAAAAAKAGDGKEGSKGKGARAEAKEGKAAPAKADGKSAAAKADGKGAAAKGDGKGTAAQAKGQAPTKRQKR